MQAPPWVRATLALAVLHAAVLAIIQAAILAFLDADDADHARGCCGEPDRLRRASEFHSIWFQLATRRWLPTYRAVAFRRVELTADGIVARVMNDGPDPVQIAQVQVDDAYWSFTADNGTELPHLGRTTLRIPYPWVHGERHVVRVLTSTGTTFDYDIAVAVPTPRASARTLGLFTLMGVYVGVIPVAIGCCGSRWYRR